jgi:signal peptidase I
MAFSSSESGRDAVYSVVMTKRKSSTVKSRSASDAVAGRDEASSTDAISRHWPSSAAIRETIESVVIAFVLAFLFRTFEAEAFVIPTGSMAPTLMGRHKDLVCSKCGCSFQINAHDEVTDDGSLKGKDYQVVAGTCPMCRYTNSVAKDTAYNGDRILVGKFLYELSDPQRWDVLVFKFPGDAQADARTNFIKRLVGLPGETVRIQHGDVWVRKGSSRSAKGDQPHAEREEYGEFEIARKPPRKLLAMLQPVFDNDYMPRIAECGWPARWQPEQTADASTKGAWSSDDYATFRTDGQAEGESWLRYHHLTPSFEQWKARENGREFAPGDIAPQLIKDFTAYNTNRVRSAVNTEPEADSLGFYWVGDLALRCTAEVESPQGQLVFELCKGGRRFHCRIDVATGQATLSISGHDMEQFQPTATTNVRGPGRHEVMLSNCDNELRLWIDGRVVEFDRPTTYDDLKNSIPEKSDRMPVGVASVGAKATLSHLAIFRDIYYIADLPYGDRHRYGSDDSRLFGAGSDGAMARNPAERAFQFRLKADQFFVLGDNSPRSKDSRLWEPDKWVPRELLIGKALFIYWPHSWDKVPYVNVPFPFFPNFARMGLVR